MSETRTQHIPPLLDSFLLLLLLVLAIPAIPDRWWLVFMSLEYLAFTAAEWRELFDALLARPNMIATVQIDS